MWGALDLGHVFRSKKVLVFGAILPYHEWWVFSPKLKSIHRASIHPIHFDEFFFSSSYGQISRKHNFCRCILPWTWLGRIVKFIGIWVLNPLKTSGGQPVALGGFGVWLGGYFLALVLIDTIIHPCFKWPFVVFCDLSVFLHDGLWCKVPLLWTLPYFVVFVTIMAFMVVQLGCSAFRICFWWFSHHFVVFQQNLDVLDGIWYFGLGRSGFHGCFDDFSLDLNFGLIIFVFRCIWQPWKVPCQICRWKNLQVRRRRAKSAGKKFKVRRCHRNFASKKIFQGETGSPFTVWAQTLTTTLLLSMCL